MILERDLERERETERERERERREMRLLDSQTGRWRDRHTRTYKKNSERVSDRGGHEVNVCIAG